MSTVQWIIFVIKLLTEYDPKVVKLGREIYDWVERNRNGEASEEKRLAFNDQANLPENKAKLDKKVANLDVFREKICQRANGRKWESKDKDGLGSALAWRKSYETMSA